MEQIEREYEENVEQAEPMEESNQMSTDAIDDGVREPTPGDVLRTLPTEAQQRGTRFISAQAMQAKLFSVYDAAAAAEDALALVQQQLTLTLNRSYYDADEIEKMASQLDSLLALESIELELEQLDHDDLVSEA
jgi:MarR-like DNA-binding transcriptional regulator SgrR of sgrS sRNA